MDLKIILAGVSAVALLGAGAVFVTGQSEEPVFEETVVSGQVVTTETETKPEEKSETEHNVVAVDSGLRNVMYYGDWSIWDGQGNYYPQDLPAEYYTHLNFAFLDFDSAGYLSFTDSGAALEASMTLDSVVWGEANAGILATLRTVRAENPNAKLGVSIGGWSKSGDFSTMAANPTTRATFIKEITSFLQYTGFDFVDIDWEYPAVVRQPDYTDNHRDEGTPSATAADKENYITLLQELRSELDQIGESNGKYYELSVALPMDQDKLSAGIAIAELFSVVDFANIMTYDAHGAFDAVTGHHTALYGNPQDPTYEKGYSIDQAVEYLLANGAVSEKIVIGAAFYSRGWANVEHVEVVTGLPGLFATASTGGQNADQSSSLGALNDVAITMGDGGIAGGVWAYRNFDSLKSTYPNLVEYWDDVAKAAYLYNGSAFFTYDNPKSLAEKANYVHENNLGGMISWQASNDKVTGVTGQRDELTKAIYDGLFEGNPLPDHEIMGYSPNVTLTYDTSNPSTVQMTLKNNHHLSEVSAVLRSVEIQSNTVTYPKLYIDTAGAVLTGTGVTMEGNYAVVDLASNYEQRFLSSGQQISISLSTSGTAPEISAVILAQRQTQGGQETGYTYLLGEGDFALAGSVAVQQGGSGVATGNASGTTAPSVETVVPSQTAVGTLENPVAWSEASATAGSYVTGSVIQYNGGIYQAKEQVWWGNPMENPSMWTQIGTVEGYVPPEPTAWSREQEAIGAYTVGSRVTHGGKTYLQVSGDTAWWCEPGTDPTIWQEQ